jgi:Dolichyl-phosphate-mannose-protein mannosyltransferase
MRIVDVGRDARSLVLERSLHAEDTSRSPGHEPSQRSQARPFSLWLLGALLAAALLQFVDLGGKSLWDDEATTVTIANKGSLGEVYAAYRSSERQPPLHYFVLHGWTRIAGTSDWAVRIPSALFSVASVLLIAWLGWRVASRRVGLLAAYLLAISPFLVLFGPMARYYSMALFLVLLSTTLLLEALLRPQNGVRIRGVWSLYVVTSIAMLLTNYTNSAFFVAQILCAAFLLYRQSSSNVPVGDRERADFRLVRRRAVISQVAIVFAFALWLAIDFGRLTDFATSSRQFAIGGWKEAALTALYPFYAWTLGETIFPWHPAALVALAVLVPVVLLGVAGLMTGPAQGWVPIIALATGVCLTVAVSQVFVRDLPFEALTSRAIGGMPFLLLVVAAGLSALPRAARVAALVALTSAAAFSDMHYFEGRQFHNAAYTLPTRNVVAMVRKRAEPTDLVISDPDLPVYYYYYRDGPNSPMLFASRQVDAVRSALANRRHDRLWVFTAGRDSTRGWRLKWGATRLDAVIKRDFRVQRTWRYVAQDPLYARLKARVQGYPSYRYKLVLRVYVRRAP